MESGAGNVADSLESLAGLDASVAVKSLAMVEPGDIPREFDAEPMYAASVRLTEPPYGSFVMTFGEATARSIAEHMTGSEIEGELKQLQVSALQEMCNIFTSGFIDRLANTLRSSIDMGTPELERGVGRQLLVEQLSHVRDDSLAVVLDSRVEVTDPRREFRVRIFLVPDPGAFVNVLDHLSIEDIHTEEPDVAGL